MAVLSAPLHAQPRFFQQTMTPKTLLIMLHLVAAGQTAAPSLETADLFVAR
jgi:hypothetical protein